MPVVVKDVINAAAPPAPADADAAAMGATATGLPICVPPLKNVTVPVVPTALLLADVMVAVKVTLVPVVTDAALAAKAVAVTAFDTVKTSVTGVVTGL